MGFIGRPCPGKLLLEGWGYPDWLVKRERFRSYQEFCKDMVVYSRLPRAVLVELKQADWFLWPAENLSEAGRKNQRSIGFRRSGWNSLKRPGRVPQ